MLMDQGLCASAWESFRLLFAFRRTNRFLNTAIRDVRRGCVRPTYQCQSRVSGVSFEFPFRGRHMSGRLHEYWHQLAWGCPLIHGVCGVVFIDNVKVSGLWADRLLKELVYDRMKVRRT